MRRIRKGRWGNALGGWRKQPRAKDGTFGHGKDGKAKKAVSKSRPKATRAANKSPASSRKSPVKSQKAPAKSQAKPAPSKRWSKKKKAAVATGVTVGVVGAGAGAYALDARRANAGFVASQTFADQKSGISFTTESRKRGPSLKFDLENMNPAALIEFSEADSVPKMLKAVPKMYRPKIRRTVQSTTYIHRGDELIGYASGTKKGNRLLAENLYLSPRERKNFRTVGAMSRAMTDMHKREISQGRKIVISKFRSEDSERIVRNQARKLGENNVIVQKRYQAGSSFTKGVIRNMDNHFANVKKPSWDKRRKAGVVI